MRPRQELTSGNNPPSLLFAGFGLTFAILWLIRSTNNTAWAKWPAMGLLGLSVFVGIVEHMHIAWPLIPIIVGLCLLIKNSKARQKIETA